MSLREAWKRWTGRRNDAADADGGVAGACSSTPSLLEELAIDPEDFADLARLMNVELRMVVATVVLTRPATVASLVAELGMRTTPSATPPAAASEPQQPQQQQQSEGGGGAVGWGRWTRTRGGVRVHRATSAAARTALAAP